MSFVQLSKREYDYLVDEEDDDQQHFVDIFKIK